MTMISLKLDDSRRLTGTNYFIDEPGAVLDALVSGIDKQQVVDAWLSQLSVLLSGVGWAEQTPFYRVFEDGVSLGFSAPMDALYAATEINEAAWELTRVQLLADLEDGQDTQANSIQGKIESLRTVIAEERHPALLTLIATAEANGVVYLADDDAFSLGYGASAECWPIKALPDPESLDWSRYHSLPLALVTGTNGKSTSVRLTSTMIKQAGLRCGVTSTDFIRVGDVILDKGDYSGPGGARTLLRHPQTEAAVLEVARGGLLRRGIPVPAVDAALVTNVAEDHLGQYGINTIEALTAAKMMVAKAVTKELVLNADNANLVAFVAKTKAASEQQALAPSELRNSEGNASPKVIEQAPIPQQLPANITWFSLNPDNPVLLEAQANQQNTCFVRDGQLIYATATTETTLVGINDIPMTLQGAAVHNVQNALGAVALSKALGIADQAITAALLSFKSDASDNPGRGNLFDYRGARLMLDFAHNVHSMDAMASTLRNMPASRKTLLLCLPGDRSDREVRALTASAMAMQPDQVWVCELPNYLRGRELGELPVIIAASVREAGLPESAIHFADSPLQGAEAIIGQLETGDLVFIMALSQRDQIGALLTEAH